MASVFYKMIFINDFIFVQFLLCFNLYYFQTSGATIGLSCWPYHHPSSSTASCHRHYTARPHCCVMTSLQHKRRYLMTAITRQPGTQKQVWPSHMLSVSLLSTSSFIWWNSINIPEWQQKPLRAVDAQLRRFGLSRWSIPIYPGLSPCFCCWKSDNIVHDRPESISSCLTHTITHYLLHFCAE